MNLPDFICVNFLLNKNAKKNGINHFVLLSNDFRTKNGQVDVYKVPLIIPKLVDICRKIVNQIIDQPVYELNLPKELKKFLLYDDIRDDSIMTNSSPMLIISSPNTPASASTSPNPTLFNQGTPAMCN